MAVAPGVAAGLGDAADPELPQPETIPITSAVTRKRFIGVLSNIQGRRVLGRSPGSRGDALPGLWIVDANTLVPIQLGHLAGVWVRL